MMLVDVAQDMENQFAVHLLRIPQNAPGVVTVVIVTGNATKVKLLCFTRRGVEIPQMIITTGALVEARHFVVRLEPGRVR
jgi:hypothetical protein